MLKTDELKPNQGAGSGCEPGSCLVFFRTNRYLEQAAHPCGIGRGGPLRVFFLTSPSKTGASPVAFTSHQTYSSLARTCSDTQTTNSRR